MTSPSPEATARFRHMRDGDDARDLAFDYDEGFVPVRRDLVTTAWYDVRIAATLFSVMAGVAPSSLLDNPTMRLER